MNDDVRLAIIETTIDQHAELLRRAVAYMETQGAINERMANHLDDSKRVWKLLEDHDKRLIVMQKKQVEICAFCTGARKLGWAVAVFASGGLAYLIKFWVDHYGNA